MICLRASVRIDTGSTDHVLGTFRSGCLETEKLQVAFIVEIVEQKGAYYLLRFDSDGECIADTWHETVDAAMSQAKFEFGIRESDWVNITDGDAKGTA